jgi:hypothetical protein
MYFFLDATEWDGISKVDRVSSGTSSKQSDGTINCGLTRDQLKEFVMYQPALLGYSLENRIKPRIRQMQERNIFFYYCPKNIMSYTDNKFHIWISAQESTWSIILE